VTEPVEPNLLDRVAELTSSVDRATAAVDRETAVRQAETEALRLKLFTARRAVRIAVTAMIVGFVATAVLIWVVRQDANHRESDRTAAAVVSCKNANESRQAIEDRMEQLVTQLGNTNAPADPTAAAVRQQLVDQFLVQFRASMPQALKARDCSPQAAVNPAPVQR
jgi:hypothetical protein